MLTTAKQVMNKHWQNYIYIDIKTGIPIFHSTAMLSNLSRLSAPNNCRVMIRLSWNVCLRWSHSDICQCYCATKVHPSIHPSCVLTSSCNNSTTTASTMKVPWQDYRKKSLHWLILVMPSRLQAVVPGSLAAQRSASILSCTGHDNSWDYMLKLYCFAGQ